MNYKSYIFMNSFNIDRETLIIHSYLVYINHTNIFNIILEASDDVLKIDVSFI